ncbi:hypothetical protein [Streptomyces sp. NPDC001889]
MNDFRETRIRVAGVEQVIRTERVGSLKQLESKHSRAVKDALISLRTKENARTFHQELAETKARTATRFPSYTDHTSARKAHPRPARGGVPDYLVQLSPGHYATSEAADSLGAAEHLDEILPGLAIARYGKGGSKWLLQHLPSVAVGRTNTHLGPVFKSRKRAREVALTELAHLDWTRTAEELLADTRTASTMQIVKWREFIAASKRNAWAKEHLREAEAKLARLGVDLAA